jgi:hypothetical protein
MNADWIAADFTVFYIRLAARSEIEQHRDFFPAIRAGEKVFFKH